MRSRSKDTLFHSGSTYVEELSGIYTSGAPPYRSSTVVDTSTLSYPYKLSEITDIEPRGIEVSVDPQTLSWKRAQRRATRWYFDVSKSKDSAFAGLDRSQIPPVKPCSHVKTEIDFCKEIWVEHQRVNSPGSPVFERTDTRTYAFKDGLQLLNSLFPGNFRQFVEDGRGDAGEYFGHDWFALTDSFHEAMDQYIPSNLMIGESIIENSIFVDAFKAVVNPSRAVISLLHAGKLLGSKIRKMSLGRACHQIAKSSANAHLTYAFGIVPAVHDILDTLKAHNTVSRRLEYLRASPGKFVPVRVKDEISSEFDSTPPLIGDYYSTNYVWKTAQKLSTAHIGCWGRVREDINYAGDWAAYLQYFGINKVVGLAWELIPFSFVIDWFTNTQERINSLTRLRTGGPFTEFCNISSSVKQVHKSDLFMVPGYDVSFGGPMITPNSSVPILRKTETVYNRTPSIPDTSGVVDFSALGLFHAVTSAGLIIQRT